MCEQPDDGVIPWVSLHGGELSALFLVRLFAILPRCLLTFPAAIPSYFATGTNLGWIISMAMKTSNQLLHNINATSRYVTIKIFIERIPRYATNKITIT